MNLVNTISREKYDVPGVSASKLKEAQKNGKGG